MTDQVPSEKNFNAQNDFVELLQTGRRLTKSLVLYFKLEPAGSKPILGQTDASLKRATVVQVA